MTKTKYKIVVWRSDGDTVALYSKEGFWGGWELEASMKPATRSDRDKCIAEWVQQYDVSKRRFLFTNSPFTV